MNISSNPGIFIVMEGVDGAGKSTQVELLGQAFTDLGREVVLSKEPTDGPWGRKLRESAATGRMSLEDELYHFVQDRKQHVDELISPSLATGKVVIVDRYFYSTMAYQGARGANPQEVRSTMLEFAPEPDIVFLIDIDPAVSVRERVAESRGDKPNEFEHVGTLQKVRDIFNDMAKLEPHFFTIDGAQSIEAIQAIIREELRQRLGVEW
jgi:dTMP kinase